MLRSSAIEGISLVKARLEELHESTRNKSRPSNQHYCDEVSWFIADGAIHLSREISLKHKPEASDLLALIVDLVELDYFGNHWYLQETLWINLPFLAKSLGKSEIRRHRDSIFPPLQRVINNPQSHHINAVSAAQSCRYLFDNIGVPPC
jgi:hypothetical protein